VSGAAAMAWVCCHLGAREHYAIPRALHLRGDLRLLVTDAWSPPGGWRRRGPARLARRLNERFHPQLASATIRPLTASLVAHELAWGLQRHEGWDLIGARNAWFQARAAVVVSHWQPDAGDHPIVFAHSYSARAIFEVAKARGWTTVLGQIDPGPEHFAIARRLAASAPEFGPAPAEPPSAYLASWRDECALADRIIVNSDWSRTALTRAGVDVAKLRVVPLAYEPEQAGPPSRHVYPDVFTAARPLRVLYVGSVSVVKGVAELLRAMVSLDGLPITLRVVGKVGMAVPAEFAAHPSIEWVGAVTRSDVMTQFQECDVLVFPSHSDGFGMAQVEAQAHGLPVIASAFCGRVVDDGRTGLVLPAVTPAAIAEALRMMVARPGQLAEFSANAASRKASDVANLGAVLASVVS